MNRIFLLSFLALLPACSTVGSGSPSMTLDGLADNLAKADVVFLGEDHGNTYGHWQQKEILEMLHDRRSKLVLSLEMFERDVQAKLDAYLRGEIKEEEFLKESRPWPAYYKHYRPLVEYAKKNKIPVIAANVPRPLASAVAYQGIEAAKGDQWAARSTTSPKDEYWDKFKEVMRDHMGLDVKDEAKRAENLKKVYKFYQAQCLKDDTMAESITDFIKAAGDERPLVIHIVGQFHSRSYLGTVARVTERMPDLKVEIVSMETAPNVVKTADGYVLMYSAPHYVEDMKKRIKSEKKKAAAKGKPSEEEPEEEIIEEEPPSDGRPALGFMPGYNSEVEGVLVEAVTIGGPSDAGGLKDGDVIVELDGEDIVDMRGYMEVLSSLSIGKKVSVVVERGGKEKKFSVKVGERGH